jgi:hypothetical protein
MNTPAPARRWQVVYPLGRTDAMRSLGTVAAPLLAGFGLATLALLVTADQGPRFSGVAVAAFALGSTLFVFCLQLTCTGLLYAAPPADRVAWQGEPGPADAAAVERALDVQRKDIWLTDRYFQPARWMYDLGLAAHLVGLAALCVPRGGDAGRWAATAVVLTALAVEVLWIAGTHRGRGPGWLLPGYRHARQALGEQTP